MMSAEDWKIRNALRARAIPRILVNLLFRVPVVDQYEAEDFLPTHVHKELTNLITRLEAQDWGIDVDRVTSKP
jgi:Holliday junction resolvasome RuvABC ATP-dependent DNA helicase subunit